MTCKAYMEGLTVGRLFSDVHEEGNIETCPIMFKNYLGLCIKPLEDAFNKIGAKEAQEFLPLSWKKTYLPY